jgi:hypothetical protein
MSSQNETPQPSADTTDTRKGATTLVDTIFDIGLAWAEFGVGQSKKALLTSAKTLEKAIATLNDLEQKLRKDAS